MRTPNTHLIAGKHYIVLGTGCWKWLRALDDWGYGVVRWQGRKEKAHRVSYRLAKGTIPEGMCVCHSCDSPACVNPGHLWLGRCQDNSLDASRKGRLSHTLTPEEVIYCRRLSGIVSQQTLARRFGVTQSTIHSAIVGKTWKHIGDSV
jgi:hypothetical protein